MTNNYPQQSILQWSKSGRPGCHNIVILLQEVDPKLSVKPEWMEKGQDEEVLSYHSNMPAHLANIKDEEVGLCLRYEHGVHGIQVNRVVFMGIRL